MEFAPRWADWLLVHFQTWLLDTFSGVPLWHTWPPNLEPICETDGSGSFDYKLLQKIKGTLKQHNVPPSVNWEQFIFIFIWRIFEWLLNLKFHQHIPTCRMWWMSFCGRCWSPEKDICWKKNKWLFLLLSPGQTFKCWLFFFFFACSYSIKWRKVSRGISTGCKCHSPHSNNTIMRLKSMQHLQATQQWSTEALKRSSRLGNELMTKKIYCTAVRC